MKRFYIFIISIALIIILILWIGPLQIIEAFKSADWRLLLLAVILHLIAVGLRAVRWGFIINKPKEFKNNYIVKTIGLFAGNFSPVRTAGEPVTAIAGKNINKISVSEGLSAGLTERFFDFVIVGLLLLISCIWLPKIRFLAIIGGFLSLSFVVLIYLVNWRENFSIWLYEKIHPIFEKLPIKEEVVDNFYEKIVEVLKSMVTYTKSFTTYKNLSLVVILSIVAWLVECLRLLTVFYAFNLEINFIAVIIIFLLANIIGVVSVLPGGIGSIEISLTGLFVLFGVPEALSGSIALADRLVSFWVVTVLGLIFSFYYAKDILDEIKKFSIDLKISKK
ncbi:MAG: flippase-like domain-containing protein [Methanomicrobiales archaeon]